MATVIRDPGIHSHGFISTAGDGGGGPAMLILMVFKLLLCLSSPTIPSGFAVLI